MAFEIWDKKKNFSARKQGPPKVTIRTAPNGRTQINFSAAVRDYLEPTQEPNDGKKHRYGEYPKMSVAVLVDREAKKVAIARVADGAQPETTYEVAGLRGSTAYISDWYLDSGLGLVDGRYPVDLTIQGKARAIVITLGEFEQVTTTKPKPSQQQVITEILNEGVTIVRGLSPAEEEYHDPYEMG